MKQRIDVIKRHRALLSIAAVHYVLVIALWVETQWAPLGLASHWIAVGTVYVVGGFSGILGYFVAGVIWTRRRKSNEGSVTVKSEIKYSGSQTGDTNCGSITETKSATIKPESGLKFMPLRAE